MALLGPRENPGQGEFASSLVSDRFRVFYLPAEGVFVRHEISPCVRLGLKQGGESRRQDMGTLSGRARPRIGTRRARVDSVWCFAR